LFQFESQVDISSNYTCFVCDLKLNRVYLTKLHLFKIKMAVMHVVHRQPSNTKDNLHHG